MSEWIGGRNPVYEVIRAGRRPIHRLRVAQGVQEKGRLREVLRQCQDQGIPIERRPRVALDSQADHHQGVALEVGDYPYCDLNEILSVCLEGPEPAFVLLLDALQDPQNLGTLLRTAEAVGVQGVLIPPRRSAGVTPSVVRASSGASEHLRIARVNLAQAMAVLKEAGIWLVGLEHTPEARAPQEAQLDLPLGLVVGSESRGMRRLVRDSCDWQLALPMRGRIDSLNAAVAGSVALYLAWQQRGFGGAAIDGQQDS